MTENKLFQKIGPEISHAPIGLQVFPVGWRVLLTVIGLAVAMILPRISFLAIYLLLLVACAASLGIIRPLLKSWFTVLPVTISLLLVYSWAYPNAGPQFWIFGQDGFLTGLFIATRLIAFVTVMYLFVISTGSLAIVRWVSSKNEDMGIMISLALSIIPSMKLQMDTTLQAQQARGLRMSGSVFHKLKVYVAVLIPVVVKSLIRAFGMATLMHVRGYGMSSLEQKGDVRERCCSLSVRNLSFTYAGSNEHALQGVSLDILPSAETWIIGPNAAGKTTLLFALAGVIPTVIDGDLSGEVTVKSGENNHATIAMLMQDSSIYLFDTVSNEIAFSLENRGVLGEELEGAIDRVLEVVDISVIKHRLMHTLSGGERQKVAIAAALAVDPQLLILDEPFEQLDPASADEILGIAREHKKSGATLIVATRAAERVPLGLAAIELGKGILADESSEANPTEAGSSPPQWHRSRLVSESAETPVLELRGATLRYQFGGGAEDINLKLRAGESLTLLGPNGAGKTTVVKLIVGLLKPQSGERYLFGEPVEQTDIADTAHSIGILFQNPNDQIFNTTAEKEVAWNLLVRGSSLEDALVSAHKVMDELGILDIAQENPQELTASQRQLIAFASVLVSEPPIILLDEPTKALDSAAIEGVLEAINRRLDRGAAVLSITHDLTFAQRLSDRCAVIIDGEIAVDDSIEAVLSSPELLHQARLI